MACQLYCLPIARGYRPQAQLATDPDDTTPHPSLSPVHRPKPEARFDVKVTTGKFGKMKGKERRQVTLVLGNNVFRYRRTLDSGKLVFSCRECEKHGTYLSAFAEKIENDEYKLIEAPSAEDHSCCGQRRSSS